MVYFLLDAASAAVKIGYSAAPLTRKPGLQTGNPGGLQLLGTIEGDRKKERAIHQEVKEYLVPDTKEWFHDTPEFSKYVNAILETGSAVICHDRRSC